MIPTSVVPIASVSMVARASATAVSAAIRYSKPYAATVSTRSSSAFAASLPFCINAKEAGTIVRPSDAGLRRCNSPEAGKCHGAGEDHQNTKREKELVTNGHHRAPASGQSGMTFLLTVIRSIFLFEHDLVGKPVPTFPDHAPSVTSLKS